MSISQNFGNVSPSLLLDFANTKTLDRRITFTRSTPACHYDGKTTAMAEQNGIYPSANLASSPQVSGATITSNISGITAPDGTETVSKFVASASNGFHYARAAGGLGTPTLDTAYTFSFYAKPAGFNFVTAQLAGGYGSGGGRSTITVDVSNGTIGGFTASQNISNLSSTATSVGNGWYRITITGSPTSQNSAPTMTGYILGSSSTNISGATNGGECTPIFTGDGTNGVYVWGFQVEQRSTATAYTPTTTQTITNYIPVLLSAGGNQPRFDCNPTTGESLGLLIEEQRTNLVTYSGTFDGWALQNSAFSTVTTAPDGTLTAQKLICLTTGGNAGAYKAVSGANTISMYAKAGGKNWLAFINTGGSGFIAWFNLSTGLVGTVAGGYTATMVSVGNGWYRCVLTAASGSFVYHQWTMADNDGSIANTENAINGIFVWGAQAEAGAFATSYIATTSASATRTADAASMTGTNFSSWFNAGEGTIYSESAPTGQTSNGHVLFSMLGTADNYIVSGQYIASSTVRGLISTVNNSNQAAISLGNGTNNKITASYKVNDFAACINGGTASTDTSGTLPIVDKANIGNFGVNLQPYTGTIKKIAYYPLRVTNAQLQALTS